MPSKLGMLAVGTTVVAVISLNHQPSAVKYNNLLQNIVSLRDQLQTNSITQNDTSNGPIETDGNRCKVAASYYEKIHVKYCV